MSFLTRLLQTTGLSLALVTASAAGVHAEDVTVQGAPGENGANGVNPGDSGGEAGNGGGATATANSPDPVNGAFAIGGVGGEGGNGATFADGPGDGGNGGSATATAATAIFSGSAGADAEASGGTGGNHGLESSVPGSQLGNGGSGGAATALATGSSGNGNVTVSATATGGSGAPGEGVGGGGGDATASSTAIASGSGDALSSATATGGNSGPGIYGDGSEISGSATAMANATAAGGGKAIATAIATLGVGGQFGQPAPPQATANAQTSFAGGSVQSTAAPPIGVNAALDPLSAEAVAQVGSGQISFSPNVTFTAIATALPDKAYSMTLIGNASNVAAALLGPGDEIFGTAILDYGSSATFTFSFRGDLILGDIGDNSVTNMGFVSGPIDLTLSGYGGIFALGGAVPEPSTWAMMLAGFAGLGFLGWRRSRKTAARAA